MRALFTQLSFLIGLVTAFELYGRQPNLPVAALLGISASCTVYIALLLGDQAVNRYFEEKAGPQASLTYLDAARDERPSGQNESESNFDAPDAMAA